jgi:single-strand DNA-binding protein
MLRLSLIGNLGMDPEVGSTQKGAPIATLRVAVNLQRTDITTGERQENTEWFRVRAMGRLVDLAQRTSKGDRVLVLGRLDVGHFQTREGEPRVSFDVWADELVSLSTARDTVGARRQTESGCPAPSAGRNSRPAPHARTPLAGSPRPGVDTDEQDLPW